MGPNIRGKVKITINGYYDTSIDMSENVIFANFIDSVISIVHVEVLLTYLKVKLVGFDHSILNKSVLIEAYTDAIVLNYCVIITFWTIKWYPIEVIILYTR